MRRMVDFPSFDVFSLQIFRIRYIHANLADLPCFSPCPLIERFQGKFEDVNAEAKKIFQIDTFEGIRMEYQRGLNNSFGVSHVAHLGASPESPATYEFSANYSQDKVCY